jgi:hypothetical protein
VLAAIGCIFDFCVSALNQQAFCSDPCERAGARTESVMTKATRIAAPAEVSAATESHPLVTITLFCAIGLLVSLGVVLLDQYLPGEWF